MHIFWGWAILPISPSLDCLSFFTSKIRGLNEISISPSVQKPSSGRPKHVFRWDLDLGMTLSHIESHIEIAMLMSISFKSSY